MATVAEQDYIKAIFKLQEQSQDVSTSSLAASLGVRAASVSGMLKKLSRLQLVSHRQYRGVRLTEKGRRSALQVLRRHRLIEVFLFDVLGMPWESVHAEAEKLEHAMSDEVLARIDRLLGFPKRDPHGSPIPSAEGRFARRKGIRLDQAQVGYRGAVGEVSDDDPVLLRHLSKIGLVPGAEVAVSEVMTVDGTLVLMVGRQEQRVSPKVASAVWISEDK